MDSLESQESLDSEGRCSRRTQWKILCVVAGVMLLIIIVTVSVVVTLPLKITFFCRCKLFQWDDCENLWSAFQQAYVGKDFCNVPMEAYNPLIAAAPFNEECSNRTMFWSKTKDLVQDFTENDDCYLTMQKTVLGFVLDDLKWCGKEGSNQTFKMPKDCRNWEDCENNPVGSFWNRASAAFADYACGDVIVVLDGSIETPFDPNSIFGSIELKRFKSPRVRSLKIVLVSGQKPKSNCTSQSIQDLWSALDAPITRSCTNITKSQFKKCDKPCGHCW